MPKPSSLLKLYFHNNHSHKGYLNYFLDPDFYSVPTFTLHWFTQSFINRKYVMSNIITSLEKYNGILLHAVTSDYINDHSIYNAIITIEIQTNTLNERLCKSLIKDFEQLIQQYERIYEVNKIFSN
ncbi:hypothetical protein C1N73_27080 (plasmid) [Priestia aryabhattai]